MHTNFRVLLGATALGFLLAGSALAETKMFAADLTGAAQVPPVETAATGKLEASLDTETKMLTWTITYEGLTGEATGAHYHGPATAEETAPPVVALEDPLASPIEGGATLTDEQIAELEAGMWYFNLHTEANPDGEIRGQVLAGAAM